MITLYDQFSILFDPNEYVVDADYIQECADENHINIIYQESSQYLSFQIWADEDFNYDMLIGAMKGLYNANPHHCHELTRWGVSTMLDK